MNTSMLQVYIYASINVKPEGGGPLAYVGHLTSIAFPTLGNVTKNLGPRVGTFGFLHEGMAPSHIVPCARRSMSCILITKPFRMDDVISALV